MRRDTKEHVSFCLANRPPYRHSTYLDRIRLLSTPDVLIDQGTAPLNSPEEDEELFYSEPITKHE